jgi:hypothetical protein
MNPIRGSAAASVALPRQLPAQEQFRGKARYNTRMSTPVSKGLQGAQDVDEAVSLKIFLAAEIGRAPTQDFLHLQRVADELAIPRPQHCGGPADVGSCHAGSIEAIVGIAADRAADLLS